MTVVAVKHVEVHTQVVMVVAALMKELSYVDNSVWITVWLTMALLT